MNGDDPFDELPELPDDVPIPKIFHSLEAGGPFSKCLMCSRSLLDGDVEYSIEIVFKQREPIIEMAVCHDCRGDLSDQISADSLEQIRTYVASRESFLEQAYQEAWLNEDAWLESCALTGVPRSECTEWQICGVFRGDKMQAGFTPLMISGLAASEMSELLSEQTRGWMNDFVGDRFGMPSEFCDSPDWTPLML